MRTYYRNLGDSSAALTDIGGLPALSVDEPLAPDRIDAYFAEVHKELKHAPTLVRPGDFVRFVVDDPDELAYAGGKTDHTTYLYLFIVVKAPRAALINDRWVSELCLVAKTAEPFKRCATHNTVYAGG